MRMHLTTRSDIHSSDRASGLLLEAGVGLAAPKTAMPNVVVAMLGSVAVLVMLLASGCALAPDIRHRERFHNPLPQLHRIAIIPFYNQSTEPTLDEIAVAEAYYAELQAIPGFEVLPIGVSTLKWREFQMYPGVEMNQDDQVMTSTFQRFAQSLGVDAVVVGAVTDFTPYSPPRLALTTRWYSANPAFHPVPAGYGLPWGTKAEKRIPRRILLETELEVARAQLATQTPSINQPTQDGTQSTGTQPRVVSAVNLDSTSESSASESGVPGAAALDGVGSGVMSSEELAFAEAEELIDPATGYPVVPLPQNWPDPARLIPDAPNPQGPPSPMPQSGPVLTHTRIYRGDDPDVTEKLSAYVYARDDGRLGGWQGYLTRSDDFIRFCCYLHITEMLEMRGGRDQSDLIFRWPISRYWR